MSAIIGNSPSAHGGEKGGGEPGVQPQATLGQGPGPHGQSLEPEPGVCLYAIGDIHGRADLLDDLMARIVDHAQTLPPDDRRRLVFLGDYIDRGPDSRGVLDRLVQPPPPGFERICLRGNHEDFLAAFLRDPASGKAWLVNGGLETVSSYGLGQDDALGLGAERLAGVLQAIMPPSHLAFLEHLELAHASGDYVFVHAGVDPRLPLHRQPPEALMWIREPFLSADNPCGGRVVVHGHTITQAPEIRPHRIGIDTGAYASGRLTALVLRGRQRSFLSTTAPA